MGAANMPTMDPETETNHMARECTRWFFTLHICYVCYCFVFCQTCRSFLTAAAILCGCTATSDRHCLHTFRYLFFWAISIQPITGGEPQNEAINTYQENLRRQRLDQSH